eukprot:Amastigsp_a514214_20.p2 type:complete len:192 gc:universal Amastigsp_a514214_20:593-18(-)
MRGVGAGDDAEHLELGLFLEPVARLGLHERGAEAQHAVEALDKAAQKLVFRRRFGVRDGETDAATRFVNVHVRRALELERELVDAVASPHGVRVAVAEPRDKRLARAVDDGVKGVVRAAAVRKHLVCCANSGNAPVGADGDRAVLDNRKVVNGAQKILLAAIAHAHKLRQRVHQQLERLGSREAGRHVASV